MSDTPRTGPEDPRQHDPYDPGYRDAADLGSADDTRRLGPFGFAAVDDEPTRAIPRWPEQPAPRERRTRFAAAVLVGALVLGAGGGLAGAATYDALAGEESTDSARVTTTQVDSGTQPAAAGSTQAVAAKVLPSVVQIQVSGSNGEGSGSGVVLDADGTILTNAHVVNGAGSDGTLTVSFNDGTTARASLVGTDPLIDLAVIDVDGVDGLAPATLGTSEDLAVGQEVVAIGSPFGLSATVTSGIVSALNRPVSVGSVGNTSQEAAYPAIQTDAAINPGNSGGPLVNLAGEVVGINASIRTSSTGMLGQQAGSIGLGFAIPIDVAAPIIDQIRNGEEPTHARLGVTVTDASGDDGSARGARIDSVEEGSAAADAGFRPGDIVTEIDGDQVTDADSLVAQVRALRPGETVTLVLRRGGETVELEVTLGSDAEDNR